MKRRSDFRRGNMTFYDTNWNYYHNLTISDNHVTCNGMAWHDMISGEMCEAVSLQLQ